MIPSLRSLATGVLLVLLAGAGAAVAFHPAAGSLAGAADTFYAKDGPVTFVLYRKGNTPVFPGDLRAAMTWGLGAATLPLLYGLFLRILSIRAWTAPAPPWIARAVVPAGVFGSGALLLTALSPAAVAANPLAWGLLTGWPTLFVLAADLLRRRAAHVRASGDTIALDRFRDRQTALILWGVSFALYNANFTSHDAVDSIPCPYAALSLAREGDFDLEEFPALAPFTNEIEFVDSPVIDTGTHGVSKYPPGGAILSVPVVGLADLLGLLEPENKRNLLFYGKVSASLYAALSVAGFFFALRSLAARAPGLAPAGRSGAAFLALLYAFGSSTWSTSSQSAWQHGFVECALAWSLWRALAGVGTFRSQAVLGLFLGIAFISRPINLLLIAFTFLPWLVGRRWRALAGVAAGVLPCVVFFMAYSTFYFGTPFSTGYGPELSRFQKPLHEGVPGLLASPNRGLFVFSPVLLFMFIGIRRVWQEPRSEIADLLRFLTLGSLSILLLFAQWNAWDGGWCYGCRMLTDILPALFLFTATGWEAVRASLAGRAAFLFMAALSVVIHALGVIFHTNDWNADPASHPWRWDRTQIGSHLDYAQEKLRGR